MTVQKTSHSDARQHLLHGDTVIGRNTGRDEFPGHVRTLAKFDRLSDFIIVLDGDSRALEDTLHRVAERHGRHAVQLLFLPGDGPPPQWTVQNRPFVDTANPAISGARDGR